MILKKIIFTIMLLSSLLFSCIWIDGTTIDGDYINRSGFSKASFLKNSIEHGSKETKLESILKHLKEEKINSREKAEQDAVISLLKGDYSNAIEKLLILEKKFPNHYSVASNLGTAYELHGEDEKALFWIKEGIKRDPSSHHDTEWLHQYILELKLALKKNPLLLKEQRAITLPKKITLDKNISINNQQHTIYKLQRALEYQLRERTTFVKPKEPIVADLLYTLGKISAQTATVEQGVEYLELAELYGFSNPKLLEKTKAKYKSILENPSLSYYWNSFLHLDFSPIIIFTSFFLIIYILLKRLIMFIYTKFIK